MNSYLRWIWNSKTIRLKNDNVTTCLSQFSGFLNKNLMQVIIIDQIFIAAAASEPEAKERGSSLISRRLHYRGLQSLFLTKRKECGYAQMGDLGCAVVCARNCGYARTEIF